MRDINKVILIGRLGGDPVKRATKSGTPVVNFSMATTRKYKPGGPESEGEAWVEETQWHNIVVWGRQAEHCAEYLRKGHGIYLEGNIRHKRYTKDGVERTKYEVHAEDVAFLTRPNPKQEVVDEEDVELEAS